MSPQLPAFGVAFPSSGARVRLPPTANFKNDNHHTSLEFIIDLFNNGHSQTWPIEIQLESVTH